MKHKLEPKIGLLVAGVLTAAAYAHACNYLTSTTCVHSSDPVDHIAFYVQRNDTPTYTVVYATSDWTMLTGTTTGSGIGATTVNSQAGEKCAGAAHWTEPHTSHTENVSYWEANMNATVVLTTIFGDTLGTTTCNQ
jgi:hypothetical protein